MPGAKTTDCMCCGEGTGFFSLLSGAPAELLRREKSVAHLRPGQHLFYQGMPPRDVFCLTEGAVKIYRAGADGTEHVLRLLGPGDLAGHRPILAGESFSASAVALAESVACAIPAATFIALLRESPDLSAELFRRLSRDLRIAEEQRIYLVHGPARRRLARLLIQLAGEGATRAAKPVSLRLPLRRREIAEMIDTTAESLSRALHGMSRDGILTTTRDEIRIRDMARLSAIAREW